MYSTLSYLTRKANFKQVNPNFPITQTIPDSEPADVFEGVLSSQAPFASSPLHLSLLHQPRPSLHR